MPLLIGTAIAYTTRNTLYITITNISISTIATLLLLRVLPESPKFLYANGKYDECRVVLTKICRWNNYDGKGNELFR
jgi:hypothetical protein